MGGPFLTLRECIETVELDNLGTRFAPALELAPAAVAERLRVAADAAADRAQRLAAARLDPSLYTADETRVRNLQPGDEVVWRQPPILAKTFSPYYIVREVRDATADRQIAIHLGPSAPSFSTVEFCLAYSDASELTMALHCTPFSGFGRRPNQAFVCASCKS